MMPGEQGRALVPWFVPVLAALWLVLRFVGLEQSPPGFYGDEFRAALHAICIGETGESAYGERWPLFVGGAGGGFYTPPFLYFSAAWAQLFGYSITSFRAIAAFFSVLTIAALYAWVRRTAGREIAAWTVFVAALSPWSFQFARIAWDPPLAPAFLMLALWAWLRWSALPAGLLAGVLAALAMYAYPPMRIQAPLVFAALFAVELAGRRLRTDAVLGFALGAGVVVLPLLVYTFSGDLNQRGLAEAVFSPEFVRENRGADSAGLFILKTTLANFAAHFSPGYLFFTGDANARHSTQRIGELGFVEVLGVGIGVMLILERWLGTGARAPANEPQGNATPRRLGGAPAGLLLLLRAAGRHLAGGLVLHGRSPRAPLERRLAVPGRGVRIPPRAVRGEWGARRGRDRGGRSSAQRVFRAWGLRRVSEDRRPLVPRRDQARLERERNRHPPGPPDRRHRAGGISLLPDPRRRTRLPEQCGERHAVLEAGVPAQQGGSQPP